MTRFFAVSLLSHRSVATPKSVTCTIPSSPSYSRPAVSYTCLGSRYRLLSGSLPGFFERLVSYGRVFRTSVGVFPSAMRNGFRCPRGSGKSRKVVWSDPPHTFRGSRGIVESNHRHERRTTPVAQKRDLLGYHDVPCRGGCEWPNR